jgi:hypothetical protein
VKKTDFEIGSRKLRIAARVLGLLFLISGGTFIFGGIEKPGLLWLIWGAFFLWVGFRKPTE